MAQTETKQEYSHPEALVDTQWIEDHLEDEKVRIA
jgi:thiosulfate/3-mercaptopyruvate sulfurtransferase